MERKSLDVGMREIAATAGVSRANVHYHFGSRLDLLAAVEERIAAELDAAASGGEGIDTAGYLRILLNAQRKPAAVVHHLLGDALMIATHASVDDRLRDFARRLDELGCEGDSLVVAAAATLFARQVAFGYFGARDIDRFVDSLVAGVTVGSGQRSRRDPA